MDDRRKNLVVASAGALLFFLALLANFVRIAKTGSIASTLELYVVHQPAHLVEVLFAFVLVALVVKGSWSPRMVTGMAVGGVLIIVSSLWRISRYWEFAEASKFPVAQLVWLFLILQLLGGLLLVVGTLREHQSRRNDPEPEPI